MTFQERIGPEIMIKQKTNAPERVTPIVPDLRIVLDLETLIMHGSDAGAPSLKCRVKSDMQSNVYAVFFLCSHTCWGCSAPWPSLVSYIASLDDCLIALVARNLGHLPCYVRAVNRDHGGKSKSLGVARFIAGMGL